MKKTIEIWGICTRLVQQDDIYRIYLTDDNGTTYQVSVSEYDVNCDLEVGRHYYASGEDATEVMERPAVFASYVDEWGRYCWHCGKHHEEGFWIGEHEYACSEECAIALMGGKAEFDEAMAEYDDDADYNPICWVEWYN